jgi:hypothetical protein
VFVVALLYAIEAQLVEAGIDWKSVTKGKEESSAMSSDYLQVSCEPAA